MVGLFTAGDCCAIRVCRLCGISYVSLFSRAWGNFMVVWRLQHPLILSTFALGNGMVKVDDDGRWRASMEA